MENLKRKISRQERRAQDRLVKKVQLKLKTGKRLNPREELVARVISNPPDNEKEA